MINYKFNGSKIFEIDIRSILQRRARYSRETIEAIPMDNFELMVRNDIDYSVDLILKALVNDEVFKEETTTVKELEKVYDRNLMPMYFPSSVWQHFKKRCMPNWFNNIFPVKTDIVYIEQRFIKHITTYTTEIKHITRKCCPHIALPQDNRDHIQFLIQEAPSVEFLRPPRKRS